MPDIIRLLPESVANQIAAGEVVQRPASVVKELLENAIDAGARSVKLYVKDAGKSLIQVTDNGSGMSETDVRMSVERHATSKITHIDDLFTVMTKGFRGEALASIAAVAQMEIRSRKRDFQLGTSLTIEGSKVKLQEPVQCPGGTSIMVKNLFFNVPARRYFLKSETVEYRHIVDEFQRLALPHPDIEMVFNSNGADVFNLPVTTLRQRIVHLFGSKYNEKIIPVEETTDIVSIKGFIGKPDATKKTRGEQFFFVNNRYIRNSYLHHAIMNAYDQLLSPGNFPFYVLHLTIDPAQIDINIHPTKTEIKFQDERAVYAILHASVRRSLGRFSVTPSIDFNQEISMQALMPSDTSGIRQPEIKVNPDYNPFTSSGNNIQKEPGWLHTPKNTARNWQDLMEAIESKKPPSVLGTIEPGIETARLIESENAMLVMFQFDRRYFVCQSKYGVVFIDQQRAHRRVLFEEYALRLKNGQRASQQLLFPESVQFNASDMGLINQLHSELTELGFEFENEGENHICISALPVGVNTQSAAALLEQMLENWKNESANYSGGIAEKIAWVLAKSNSVKYGQMLSKPEMEEITDKLLKCDMPWISDSGKPTIVTFTSEQLNRQFS